MGVSIGKAIIQGMMITTTKSTGKTLLGMALKTLTPTPHPREGPIKIGGGTGNVRPLGERNVAIGKTASGYP